MSTLVCGFSAAVASASEICCPVAKKNGARLPAQLDEFILGIQASGSETATYLPELGVKWTRFSIGLNRLVPEIPDPDLTLAEAEANPEMIDAWISDSAWASLDGWMRSLTDAGLELFPVVGLGWEGTYATIDGELATQDSLGPDTYLAYY